jgi:hypothetical protein
MVKSVLSQIWSGCAKAFAEARRTHRGVDFEEFQASAEMGDIEGFLALAGHHGK